MAACLALVVPTAASAQADLDASNRATARRVSEVALDDFRAGRWEDALRGFDEARRLLPVPTLATFSARCLVKLGRLVEASERYRRAVALPIDPALTSSQQAGQRTSQTEAQAERDALMSRIPTLVIETDRAPARRDEIRLDGVVIPLTQLGVARLVDPGPHRVALVRGGVEIDVHDVTLLEGAKAHARLAVGTPPPDPPPAPPFGAEPNRARRDPIRTFQVLGWTGVGVGAATLALSGITFATAASISSDLADECDPDCPRSLEGRVEQYDALKTVSVASLIGGIVLAGAGVTLLLVAPSDPDTEPTAARARLRVSARSADLAVRF